MRGTHVCNNSLSHTHIGHSSSFIYCILWSFVYIAFIIWFGMNSSKFYCFWTYHYHFMKPSNHHLYTMDNVVVVMAGEVVASSFPTIPHRFIKAEEVMCHMYSCKGPGRYGPILVNVQLIIPKGYLWGPLLLSYIGVEHC